MTPDVPSNSTADPVGRSYLRETPAQIDHIVGIGDTAHGAVRDPDVLANEGGVRGCGVDQEGGEHGKGEQVRDS